LEAFELLGGGVLVSSLTSGVGSVGVGVVCGGTVGGVVAGGAACGDEVVLCGGFPAVGVPVA